MTIPAFGTARFGLVTDPHGKVFAQEAFVDTPACEEDTKSVVDKPITASLGCTAVERCSVDTFRKDSSLDHLL